MEISNSEIDRGKSFDREKTSFWYAKYRDIYPETFYQKIKDRNLCVNGQSVLDIGTGTQKAVVRNCSGRIFHSSLCGYAGA